MRNGDTFAVAAASIEAWASEVVFGIYFDTHLTALETVGCTVDMPAVGILWATAMDSGGEHWEENSEKRGKADLRLHVCWLSEVPECDRGTVKI